MRVICGVGAPQITYIRIMFSSYRLGVWGVATLYRCGGRGSPTSIKGSHEPHPLLMPAKSRMSHAGGWAGSVIMGLTKDTGLEACGLPLASSVGTNRKPHVGGRLGAWGACEPSTKPGGERNDGTNTLVAHHLLDSFV